VYNDAQYLGASSEDVDSGEGGYLPTMQVGGVEGWRIQDCANL
jgi:hypothetical protein